MQSHLNVTVFSALISELHERSRFCSPLEIMHWCANELSKLIGYDSSWFGWSDRVKVSDFRETKYCGMEATILQSIPIDFFDEWKKIRSDDVILRSQILTKKNTLTYSRLGSDQTDGMIEITDRFNVGQIACSSVDTDISTVSLVLLGWRKGKLSCKWKREELQFMRAVLTHVKLSVERALCQGGVPRLLVDDEGHILVASPEAMNLLRASWPGWPGNSLPQALSGRAIEEQNGLLFQRVDATGFLGQNLHYLAVNRNVIAISLTAREREVTEYVAKGLSYKEIARALQIAPATVRNHIRVSREKLGAKNKAALVNLVSGGMPFGN